MVRPSACFFRPRTGRARAPHSHRSDPIDNHYHFSDGHLAAVKGYETYGKMAKTFARLQSDEERVRATEFYAKIQIVGTPEHCIQQIAELQRVTGTDHVVTEFSFGCIPHSDAEKNRRLFPSKLEPRLQQDAAFATPPAPILPQPAAASPSQWRERAGWGFTPTRGGEHVTRRRRSA
jgi:alkanesulfonate monooxygenase SsuD/methylene tetrahydromethanopterin reductase-like flavin-dependent oxidoreductase (luciferase family)